MKQTSNIGCVRYGAQRDHLNGVVKYQTDLNDLNMINVHMSVYVFYGSSTLDVKDPYQFISSAPYCTRTYELLMGKLKNG